MQENYLTLRKAFERADDILTSASASLANSQPTINTSDIATVLIQYCGRFAERYASDMLITWDEVRKLIEARDISEPEEHIICFGIRKNGVDSNSFIMQRLKHTVTPLMNYVNVDCIYRSILALEIKITPPDENYPFGNIVMTLKDITNDIYKIEDDDSQQP